jgi:hypothetical protein
LNRKAWGAATSMQQGLDTWLWQLMTEMPAIFGLKNSSARGILGPCESI